MASFTDNIVSGTLVAAAAIIIATTEMGDLTQLVHHTQKNYILFLQLVHMPKLAPSMNHP